ncbi:MAG: aminopeptidase [Clostridia bacterium]|nr:aminopeptidase [Clostridia bacterium]
MDLKYKRKNIYEEADEAKMADIYAFAEGYKAFLNVSKTERGASAEAERQAVAAGFRPFSFGEKLKAGDKRYFINRGKNIFLIRVGTEDVSKDGIRIMVAHVDSPRLDLKPNPLYEKDGLCYLKTHYYGGIKKYQWTTIPMALQGVVMLPGGEKKEVNIGDEEGDPVFYITDLLPHLSGEQNSKPTSKAIEGESLNAVIGALPLKGDSSEDEEGKDKDKKGKVKDAILKLLNEKYGMTEIDFQCSELCLVPAGKARDIGLDRALIFAYGHDDKVCAYPEMRAVLDCESPHTVMAVFADKEETGSEGTTGMQSKVINDVIDTIAASFGANPIEVRYHSKCISADVTAGYDPTYPNAFESRNSAYVSCGAAVSKYTGARGKSSTNDAPAEYMGFIRDTFDANGVIWQTGELGAIDMGGGGTVAMYIANLGIDTVDIGVPVLSMHAPYELISKADVYSLYEACVAFCK